MLNLQDQNHIQADHVAMNMTTTGEAEGDTEDRLQEEDIEIILIMIMMIMIMIEEDTEEGGTGRHHRLEGVGATTTATMMIMTDRHLQEGEEIVHLPLHQEEIGEETDHHHQEEIHQVIHIVIKQQKNNITKK